MHLALRPWNLMRGGQNAHYDRQTYDTLWSVLGAVPIYWCFLKMQIWGYISLNPSG